MNDHVDEGCNACAGRESVDSNQGSVNDDPRTSVHKRFHYCWVVSAACTTAIFICIGLVTNGFSMYLPYIVESGISDSDMSIVVNIRGAISLVSMLLVHRFYHLVSARVGIFIACLCTAAAYLLYGMAGGFPMYVAGSVLTGISYGLGSMIIISEVLRRWFAKSFNLSVGMAVAGTGVATIIMPLIVVRAVESFGLSTSFIAEAGFIFLLSVIVLLLIRDSPEEKGTIPYGTDEGYEPEATVVYRGKTDLPRPIWIRFGFICFVMGCIGGPGLVFLSMLFESTGSSAETAAISISIIGVIMTVNKVAIGRFIDKMGTCHGILLFGTILIVGLFLTLFLTEGDMVRYIVIVLTGIGFAMMMVCPASFAKDIALPGQYFDTVRGLEIAYVFGSFIFALIPGTLDTLTGSYVISYVIMGVMLIVSLTLMVAYYRKHPKKDAATV